MKIPFALPLRIIQDATDTPDEPGTEKCAVIGDAKRAEVCTLATRATARLDNERAAYIIHAVNAYGDILKALEDCAKCLMEEVNMSDGDDHPTIQRHKRAAMKARAELTKATAKTGGAS